MKKILGSLLGVVWLMAAHYSVTPSKTIAYLKEPILLDLNLTLPNKEEIVWVKFEPKRAQEYEVHLLAKRDTPQGYTNRYLLFALKSGTITVPFTLTIKRTTKKELQKDILGTGYEQTKIIEGTIEEIAVPPLKLQIKPAHAQLYGDYQLTATVEPRSVSSYEPVYVTYTLRGNGYPPNLIIAPKTVPPTKILADKPQKSVRYTEQGAKVTAIFRYAIVSERPFDVSPIRLKLFDYRTYKTLATPKVHIEVTKAKGLLDRTTEPPPIEPVARDVARLLANIAIFVAGFLSALVLVALLWQRYKEHFAILSSDTRELLALLAARYPNRFEEQKRLLTEAMEGKRINLLKLKLQIIKALR